MPRWPLTFLITMCLAIAAINPQDADAIVRTLIVGFAATMLAGWLFNRPPERRFSLVTMSAPPDPRLAADDMPEFKTLDEFLDSFGAALAPPTPGVDWSDLTPEEERARIDAYFNTPDPEPCSCPFCLVNYNGPRRR